MPSSLSRHNDEILRNRRAWAHKPLLRAIYDDFYARIAQLIDRDAAGPIVEIGSGIGNLGDHLPNVICSDLFPNPWLDLVCDGYELPFADGVLSHLILFDVFHHLQAPAAFLGEARRVLGARGRLILFEPYVSLASLPVYGLLHHEPVGLRGQIDLGASPPRERAYYAAQGNATRLFFGRERTSWIAGWRVTHRSAFAAFDYLLSGGFSRPAFYPAAMRPVLERVDRVLSRWPRAFGSRCLVALDPVAV